MLDRPMYLVCHYKARGLLDYPLEVMLKCPRCQGFPEDTNLFVAYKLDALLDNPDLSDELLTLRFGDEAHTDLHTAGALYVAILALSELSSDDLGSAAIIELDHTEGSKPPELSFRSIAQTPNITTEQLELSYDLLGKVITYERGS